MIHLPEQSPWADDNPLLAEKVENKTSKVKEKKAMGGNGRQWDVMGCNGG